MDDAPAGQDGFGSHAPISDAVHELITTEAGGRTIGLEGGWGSGKSTVVRLLSQRLDGPDAQVVVFDAWAHEGDPLRRSFLETLIERISAKGWIEDGPWRTRREELARRRRVEHTRPVSRIERPAILAGAGAVLFAILAPLGAALIEAGLAASKSTALWSGVTISLVLALVVLLGTFWLLRGRSRSSESAVLSLFSVESVRESTREMVETPDPTSIEFESTFRDLMHEALSDHPARRLVFVVDNLDRVSPDDARSIWATLQTFLHHLHDEQERWLSSLWVLLPYDRDGIARLWDGRASDTDDKAVADEPANDESAGTQSSRRVPLVDSFIDKSIQVRFEVPLPLVSDWRAYLEATLELALPECDEADSYVAYRLYAHRSAGSGRAPSPREIKQYINGIGALHRRWQHSLPFTSLAYYASLGIDGTRVAERLRRGTLPEPGPADLLSVDVDAHLAAIAFNADPDRARQLLLGPLLDRALGRDTSDELVELLDRPGSWEALLQSSIVQQGMGTPTLLNAAARVVDIPEAKRPSAEWQEAVSLIARQGIAGGDWPPLTRDSAGDFSGLLSLVSRNAASNIANRAIGTPILEGDAASWADGAHLLLRRFAWLSLPGSGEPPSVSTMLGHFATLESSADYAARFEVEPATRKALDDLIVEQITEEPDTAASSLSVLQHTEPGFDWGPFREAAVNRLRNGAPSRGVESQPNADESRSLIGILRLEPQLESQERAALVNEGVALEYVWIANQEGNAEALGDWFYEELFHFSAESSDTRSYPGNASAGKNVFDALLADPTSQPVAQLAQTIERQGNFDLIASIGGVAEGRTLAAALVGEMWQSERFGASLNGHRFLELWPHILRAETTGAFSSEDLVGVACSRPTFVAELCSDTFATNRISMYVAVLGTLSDPDEGTRLAYWVATSLSQLTREQWQTVTSGNDWVALLTAVHDSYPDARIGGAYAQGLGRYLEQVASGSEIDTSVSEQWSRAIVPMIASDIRAAYAEEAARVAVNRGGGLTPTFFALAGETLADPHFLSREDVRNGLMPNLVVERNSAGLSWLIDAFETEGALAGMPENGLSALAAVIPTSLGQDDDIDGQLRQIAALIGLELEAFTDE